jgi:hypothetical protein
MTDPIQTLYFGGVNFRAELHLRTNGPMKDAHAEQSAIVKGLQL